MLHNRPGLIINCYRADEKRHTKTTIKDLKDVIANFKSLGIPLKITENKQLKQFSFANGSEMGFHGTRDILNVHGLKQHIAWENEVMEITYAAHKQIAQRTSEVVYMDFNPSFNHHWVFDKIMSPGMLGSKTHYIHSTFNDNSFLTDAQVEEIEQYNPAVEANVINGTASQWHWDVYGLGKRGKVEGVIFTDWEIVPDSMLPPREVSVRWGGGMDFGFHPDPATLIECRLFQDCLWLQEHMYQTELIATRSQSDPSYPCIQNNLEEIKWPKQAKIYADRSRKDTIIDLRLAGYNMIGADQSPGTIMFGINLIKSFRVLVAESSINLQMELEHYRWSKDSTGAYVMGKPVDKYNHLLDPLRYWCRSEAFMYRESIKSTDEQKRQSMPRRRQPQPINRVRH
jgi:phage terminase large subunit